MKVHSSIIDECKCTGLCGSNFLKIGSVMDAQFILVVVMLTDMPLTVLSLFQHISSQRNHAGP